MIIPKDHHLAIHTVRANFKYTLNILYCGSNPFGPQGGPVGMSWMEKKYTLHALKNILEDIRGEEFDLTEQISRAKVVARYGEDYLWIKELPDDQILSVKDMGFWEDRTLSLLERRRIPLLPEEELPLLIGHTWTEAGAKMLEKRLRKRRRCSR